MVYAHQIREVISQFLESGDGKQFVVGLERLTFDIDRHGDPEAIRLASDIRAAMAHTYVGHIDREALVSRLRDLLENKVYFAMGASAGASVVGSTSDSPAVLATWEVANSFVDIRYAAECAR